MYIKPFHFLTYILYVVLHLPIHYKKIVYAEQLNNSLIAKCVHFLSSQFSCDAVFVAKRTHFRRILSYPLDTVSDTNRLPDSNNYTRLEGDFMSFECQYKPGLH
jgi:hypothetical protein